MLSKKFNTRKQRLIVETTEKGTMTLLTIQSRLDTINFHVQSTHGYDDATAADYSTLNARYAEQLRSSYSCLLSTGSAGEVDRQLQMFSKAGQIRGQLLEELHLTRIDEYYLTKLSRLL